MIVLQISDLKNAVVVGNDGHSTGVTVQDLVNTVCDLLDGTQDHDIEGMVGDAAMAERMAEIRNAIQTLWTYPDGRKVI
jgi:hypothetical protein